MKLFCTADSLEHYSVHLCCFMSFSHLSLPR